MRRVAALFAPLLLMLASASAQAASDCSLARDEIERDKCYSQNAAESQRNRDAVRQQHESYYQRAQEPRQDTEPFTMERLRSDLEKSARAREEQEERERDAAARAEARLEQMRRDDEEVRLWRESEKSRQAAEAKVRIEAVKASIADPGHPTPFEYLRLIDAAYPMRAMAVATAEHALVDWPRELAFPAGLALTTGCLGDMQVRPDEIDACDWDKFLSSRFDRMAQAFNGGPVVDRMRFCALVHAYAFDIRKQLGWSGKWQRNPPGLARLKPYLDQCEQGIPEVPARTRAKLWNAMAEAAANCCNGISSPQFTKDWDERWNFLMHPGWKKLDEGGYADHEFGSTMVDDTRYVCPRQNNDKRCDSLGGIGWQKGYLSPRR